MRCTAPPIILGVGLLALLLAACSGGAERQQTPKPSPTVAQPSATPTATPVDETAREISTGELSRMVLPKAELGAAYQNFPLSEDSGFASKEQVVENDLNPTDEGQDLDRFGFANAYSESYDEPSLADPEAPLPSEGPTNVGTTVYLFRDAPGAAGYLDDELADIKNLVGSAVVGGRLESFQEFAVSTAGTKAWGGRAALTFTDETGEQTRVYVTFVNFHRGRLFGSVFILRVDDLDVSAEARTLAEKLDQRLLAVLRGQA